MCHLQRGSDGPVPTEMVRTEPTMASQPTPSPLSTLPSQQGTHLPNQKPNRGAWLLSIPRGPQTQPIQLFHLHIVLIGPHLSTSSADPIPNWTLHWPGPIHRLHICSKSYHWGIQTGPLRCLVPNPPAPSPPWAFTSCSALAHCPPTSVPVAVWVSSPSL